jgi:hypothetical protein
LARECFRNFPRLIVIDSFVPGRLPVRRRANRYDATHQSEQADQYNRPPYMVARESPQYPAMHADHTNPAAQYRSADEAKSDGDKEVRPFAFFHNV